MSESENPYRQLGDITRIQWEYQITTIVKNDLQHVVEVLNSAGNEGWELVSYSKTDYVQAIFKRVKV